MSQAVAGAEQQTQSLTERRGSVRHSCAQAPPPYHEKSYSDCVDQQHSQELDEGLWARECCMSGKRERERERGRERGRERERDSNVHSLSDLLEVDLSLDYIYREISLDSL